MNENYSQHSHDDNDNIEDEDTCTPTELELYFKHKYKIHDETTVTYDNNYILSLAKDESLTCLAAGLSDGSVRIFEISTERGLYVKPPQSKTAKKCLNICGLRFLDETPNLLLVGTTNGLVRLLDLRTQGEITRFESIPGTKFDKVGINCFDRNSNSTLLSMGTTEYQTDVHLLFYDIRSSKKAFNYTESHQDDVTALRFHPKSSDILCSGSTDGLINVYNVSKIDEDDALLTTINSESSVSKLNWHSYRNGQDIISCLTHTNDFKTYTFDGDLIAEFDRLKVTDIIKRKNEANCTLIDCHNTSSNDMMLLTGSNLNEGEILRSCIFKKGQLVPHANFERNGQIVRESILDAKTNVLITAGEAGIVTLWTPLSWQTDLTNTTSSSSNLKMKSIKSKRATPY